MSRRLSVLNRFRRRRYGRSLYWYESTIFKAALIMSLVLSVAYTAGIIVTSKAIDTAASLTYDEDVAQSMSDHVKLIRELYETQRSDFDRRLTKELRSIDDPSVITADQMRALLLRARFNMLTSEINIDVAESPTSLPEKFRWSNNSALTIGPWRVSTESGEAYRAFLRVRDVLQKYRLIGSSLDRKIKPKLHQANFAILAMTFFMIMLIFFFYANRFQKSVEAVIDGFTQWTEHDREFRFDKNWKGELRLITTQFNAMADDVEANRRRNIYLEKVASWQTIARKLAHEIKNPLTPIQMMVSQLKRRYQGEDLFFGKLLNDAQTIISEEVTSLRRMVDHFSDFARLPAPNFSKIDLVPLIERTTKLQQAAFENDHVVFLHQQASAVANVDGDLIRQVIINLIKNAAEAVQHQTERNIEVSIREDTYNFLIDVKDNGPGIPEEMQKNIFEAYFTTKHTGPTPGMGLGLAICQKIIVDHSGELVVQSQPGNTVFTVKLPKEEQSEAA